MSTPLKAITVVKNLHIAIINLSTLCCMGVVIALCPLRFSPPLWEHTAAQVLWAVTPICHGLRGGGCGRNTTPLRCSVNAGQATLGFLVFINEVLGGYTDS